MAQPRRRALLAAVGLVSAGILGAVLWAFLGAVPPSVTPGPAEVVSEPFRPYTVVSPIDTGIDPYHVHFLTNETYPSWFLEAMGVTRTCNLTMNGTWDERVAADRPTCWDLIVYEDVVYFNGTKIFATMGDQSVPADETPILDDHGHGTGVTGAVLNSNPDAIIFFVEGFSDQAVLKAAQHPLVDVLTTSFGPIFSIPVPGIADVTRIAVVENGKLHTGAADNSKSPAIQDPTAGPPWSIGIAGWQENGSQGKEGSSGSFIDIIADWRQTLPEAGTIDGYRDMAGTSFATPKTAGILSRVIQEVRTAAGDNSSGARGGLLVNGTVEVTNSDIRGALNLAAWYPPPGTYDPRKSEGRASPINPVAPYTQSGWGIVNMSVIEPMRDHLLGVSTLPPKRADAVAYMAGVMRTREAYWGAYPGMTEAGPGDEEPALAVWERRRSPVDKGNGAIGVGVTSGVPDSPEPRWPPPAPLAQASVPASGRGEGR